MMDIDHGWFETLNCPSIDHQQQTYVTKHDLELLHKKIIATDLIVQKYQDANKALLRLQSENDDLKQQIEQITNECCIFGKQVTECTQECDNLKEQIEILNGEKRELHQQLRVLQDENTNNYHEIMVLKQYESLKEINDQLTKTVDRQHKNITKLQLQLQRKSPTVYKSDKNKQEPSETDIALTHSQKSVRELKLTLGRLVNFIQSSQIEIPTALHIRPVLKAHDINDDFLEIEGELVFKPVKKVAVQPVVSQTDDDDDDDGDFIDVNHSVQPLPVNTVTPSVDIIEETPKSSKTSSRQKQKKKEIPKTKSTKKRRQKDTSTSEKPSTKIDELATELEIALSQSNQQHTSPPSAFLSDDDEDKTHQSNKQQLPIPVYTPIILQTPIIHREINSSISIIPTPTKSISNNISFLSDDDNDERLPPSSSPVFTPILEHQAKPTSSINEPTISSLHVDSITPMEIEISDKPTKYMSFLSEDDDDKSGPSVFNPVIEQPFINQEYISPLECNEPILDIDNDDYHTSQSSDIHSSLSSTIHTPTIDELQQPLSVNRHSSSNIQVETIIENIQDSLLNENDSTPSSIPPNTLDSNRTKIVLHLLHFLTQTPVPLKRLRLVRRRIQQKQIPEEQVVLSTEDESDHEKTPTINTETPEQPKPIEENSTTIDELSDNRISLSFEEQLESTEEIHTIVSEALEDQLFLPMEELSQSIQENTTTNNETLEDQMSMLMVESLKPTEESHTIVEYNTLVSKMHEEQPYSIEENRIDEQLTTTDESSIISSSQESMSIVEPIQFKQPLLSTTELEKPFIPSISEISKQSLLKPFQISVIHRLLNTLTNLPFKPLTLPMPFPLQKRKRKTVVKKPSVTPSRQPSNRISRSPTRMQTRSLNSIRSCIARCNQPKTVTKKRTATELLSSSPPPSNAKRRKSTRIEQNNNEYDLIKKFINSFSKEINDELRNILEHKLNEDILLFNDNIYRILSELMINKCDIILQLVKKLHPYEESIRILLSYINSKSTLFQQHFITKLNQSFEYEIKQQQISNNRIKILNRLFFLTCSTFPSLSSVIVYARLFDIGYHFSHDILLDGLSFISNICSSLISIDSKINSSNILLHQILFDILQKNQINISFEYLENLLIDYHKSTYDQEDLIRSFILISRHQTWSWCSNELCSKFFFPLLNQINDRYQQRIIILIIIQHILFIYKDHADFKQDMTFHDQIKQLLLSFKTLNRDECIVRDKIFFILHTCY